MKKNLFLLNNLKSRRRPLVSGNRSWYLTFGVIAIVFSVLAYNFGDTVESWSAGVFFRVASPLLAGGNRAMTKASEVLPISRRSLLEELGRLRLVEDRFTTILADNARLRQENDALIKLAGGQIESEPKILARVVSRPNKTPFDILVIDRGRKNTAPPPQPGWLILGPEGVLLGEVIEVNTYSSKVALWSTPKRVLNVGIGKLEGVFNAVGAGGGNFRVSLPRDFSVVLGEVVTAPGFSGRVIGVVGLVKKNTTDSNQEIYFRSPTNLYSLTHVFLHEYNQETDR